MQNPPAPAPNAPGKNNPVTVVLLLVIAILLAVIAALVVTRPSCGVASAPQAEATPAAGGQAAAPGADSSPAAPQEGPAAAASETDAQRLQVMHGEVRRDPGDGQALGQVDAPVVLVLYSDFACPYCTLFAQQVHPAIKDLVDAGTLRIEWRDLAQITETSPLAAQAGLAAAEQGKFWEFHDVVYAAADPNDHPTYSEESLVAFAQQAGVPDIEAFKTTMSSAQTVEAVVQAKSHAHQLGITGTPFMIVNDAFIGGYKDAAYVRATILDQAQQAQGK